MDVYPEVPMLTFRQHNPWDRKYYYLFVQSGEKINRQYTFISFVFKAKTWMAVDYRDAIMADYI